QVTEMRASVNEDLIASLFQTVVDPNRPGDTSQTSIVYGQPRRGYFSEITWNVEKKTDDHYEVWSQERTFNHGDNFGKTWSCSEIYYVYGPQAREIAHAMLIYSAYDDLFTFPPVARFHGHYIIATDEETATALEVQRRDSARIVQRLPERPHGPIMA